MNTELQKVFESHGYTETDTGGGCKAWISFEENGDYVLITDIGGGGLPDRSNEACIVGLYTSDGEVLKQWDASCVDEALHAGNWWVREYYSEETPVE